LHDATAHVPPVQPAVPLATAAHALPQLPQLVAVVMLVSQPLAALPSQSAQPAAQVGKQVLLVQVVVPCALLQAVPQAPQFDASVAVLASQPSAYAPLQFA
jgi:hypothetical protein